MKKRKKILNFLLFCLLMNPLSISKIKAERQQRQRNNLGTSSRVTKEKSGGITKQFEMTQRTHALPGGAAPLTGRSDPYHPDNTYDLNNMSMHLDPMRNPRKRPSKDHVWNKNLKLWVRKALPLIKDPYRGHELPLAKQGYTWEWNSNNKQWNQVKLPSSSGSPQVFGVSPHHASSYSLPQNTYNPNTTYCYLKNCYVLKKHHTKCQCYNPNY